MALEVSKKRVHTCQGSKFTLNISETSRYHHSRIYNWHSPKHYRRNTGLRSKVYHEVNRVATRKDFLGMDKSKLFEVFLTSRRRVCHGGAEQLFVNRGGRRKKGLIVVVIDDIYSGVQAATFDPLVSKPLLNFRRKYRFLSSNSNY